LKQKDRLNRKKIRGVGGNSGIKGQIMSNGKEMDREKTGNVALPRREEPALSSEADVIFSAGKDVKRRGRTGKGKGMGGSQKGGKGFRVLLSKEGVEDKKTHGNSFSEEKLKLMKEGGRRIGRGEGKSIGARRGGKPDTSVSKFLRKKGCRYEDGKKNRSRAWEGPENHEKTRKELHGTTWLKGGSGSPLKRGGSARLG